MSADMYVLYKGDEVIGVGTARELAERCGVTPQTIAFYSTATWLRRCGESRNRLVAVRVREEDIDEEGRL